MIRFIMPAILIGIGVVVFFMFTNPLYSSLNELRTQRVSYDKALDNHKSYKNKIDLLVKKDNDIKLDDKMKIVKLLPENIDNIRLILEIEQIAFPYGMVLKDVKYSVTTDKTKSPSAGEATAIVQGGGAVQFASKDYGVWDLSFSTTGTYNNFLNFLKDLQNNLRIVDISSIQFSSSSITTGGSNTTSVSPSLESYKYDFKIKTYWLKN